MRWAKVSHDGTTEPPSEITWLFQLAGHCFGVFSEKKHENGEEEQFRSVNPLLLVLHVTWKLKFWK